MSLLEKYQELLELTHIERTILQEGKFSELHTIMDEKKVIIQKIEESARGPDLHLNPLLDIISQIKEMGDENREILEKEIKRTREQLEKLIAGWEAVQDYNKFSRREAAILDIKG